MKRMSRRERMLEEALATMLEAGMVMQLLMVIPLYHDVEMGLWFCAKCDGPGESDPRHYIHEGDCPYPNGFTVMERLRQEYKG